MKKKVLLLGSSFSALPILKYLQKSNFEVTVCGSVKSDPCHNFADNSVYINYSNIDEVELEVKNNKYDYIVPSSNDTSYLTCSRITKKFNFLGIDSIEATNIIHNKEFFRNFCDNYNIISPKSKTISLYNSEEVFLNFPLLVKPTDSFSGKGITKVTNQLELTSALNRIREVSKDDSCVVEEFVEGTLHSHSAFVRNGKIVKDFFVDEFCTTYQYQVNCSNYPSKLGDKLRNLVKTEVSRIIDSLNLVDGLLHTQFISENEKFWIIESMRRAPGDLYGHMIKLSTGFNYTAFYVNPFVGIKNENFNAEAYQEKPISRHTVSSKEKCYPISLNINIPFKNIEIVNLKTSGQLMDEAPFDKHSILFFEHDNLNSIFENTVNLSNIVKTNNFIYES
jgi:biotin carboxylase